MKRIPILALAPIAMLAACGSADPEQVLETVRATEQAQFQAISTKDLRGAVRNYADGAVLVVPGRPAATDGEAIAATFDTWLKDPNFAIEMKPGPAWASERRSMRSARTRKPCSSRWARTLPALPAATASGLMMVRVKLMASVIMW